MTKSKGGLGRGIASLIPTGPTTNTVSDVLMGGPPRLSVDAALADADGVARPDGPRYQEIKPSDIRPNPRNPRTVFDEDSLAELEHSLREFGMLQPVVVRAVPRGTGQLAEQYELVMGERRWRAAQRAGLDAIPALVRKTEDADLLRNALLENIHRANLNPLEEAAAYQQLLDEFEVTHDELAARLGRSRPVISNTIRLLKLPVPVQRRVAAGVLSAGHARALLGLDNPDAQEELAARIVAEGLSVRGTEEQVTMLGSATPKKRQAPRKKLLMPGLDELAQSLSDRFDTRVKVELGRRKGKITLEFATVDDLERIVGIMAPATGSRKAADGGHPPSAETDVVDGAAGESP
ncbi:MAG: ParB/RepB/Spo0J family partition protein [Actinomycetota bacterium]|nr:ParB/RepB/Spo0J family partition protein [Actinomycetota bacterium]